LEISFSAYEFCWNIGIKTMYQNICSLTHLYYHSHGTIWTSATAVITCRSLNEHTRLSFLLLLHDCIFQVCMYISKTHILEYP
jgi:hypothetical protein